MDWAIFAILAAVACAGLGAMAGVYVEHRRTEVVLFDLKARLADMAHRCAEAENIKADNRFLSSFLVVLPDVVRRLNSNMTSRNIPPLLGSTLQQIFEPRQILIYITRGKDELALAHARGLPEDVSRNHVIKFGAGRIGTAATYQAVVDREDMLKEAVFRKQGSEMSDPIGLSVDLIAPMVHEGETLGVICVSDIGRRQRDEKRMVKLVADLGSLALNNSKMISGLEATANHDSLTGLATKRFLNYKLGDLTHQAQQTHSPLSVIIFDIDHFKKLNDTWGHLAGDEILKKVAAIMKSEVRSEDLAARYGGEEFVVLLPNTAKEDAARIAEKIRRAIEAHAFTGLNGQSGSVVKVTISGGVAGYLIDGNSSNEVLSAADQALYLAKEHGRNRIVESHIRYLSDDDTGIHPSGIRLLR